MRLTPHYLHPNQNQNETETETRSTMLATAGGIGLFLAFIGLQKSEGLGAVVADPATLVSLGGCPSANQVHFYSPASTDPAKICRVDWGAKKVLEANLGAPSPNYMCKGGRLHSASLWLGLAGFLLIVLLMARRVNGAIMAGIMATTFVSWVPGHGASFLGAGSDVAGGAARLEEFRRVVSLPDARATSLAWSFSAFANSQLWVALVTFLYLDFLGESSSSSSSSLDWIGLDWIRTD